MMRRTRATGALFLLAVSLASCGKAPTKSPAEAASGSAPSAAPPAPLLPAQTVANKLLGGDFSAPDGYSIRQALACDPPTLDVSWAVRCRAILNDSKRDGRPAIVDIELYDHDVTLQNDDGQIKDHIASFPNTDQLGFSPDITETMAKTGKVISLPSECHQAIGRPNSPAYCLLQANARVIIVTGVAPLYAEHRGGITFSTVNGQTKSDASQDCDHASDLSFAVMTMINDG